MKFGKKFRIRSFSASLLLIILGIVLVLNFLGSKFFFRFDLTSDKQYTISQSTRSLLSGLDDIVTIKVYFSEKLPPNLLAISQYVHDLLDEYAAFSQGNIQVRYVDPASNSDIGREVAALGIPQIQMNVLEKDKLQVINGYLGIGVFYVDQYEILPVVDGTQNLEYDLSSGIRKVTETERKVVGFLTGHNERTDYESFSNQLSRNYEVRSVDVSSGALIEGIDTLIVAGPTEKLSDRDLFAVDQFLMNGGNAIFLVDTVSMMEGLQIVPIDSGFGDYFSHFGVSVGNDLVLDTLHEMASFSQGYVRYILPYPFWLKVVDFSKNNPAVSKVESAVFPWASSLRITEKEGINAEILARTSSDSWLQTGNFNLDPNQRFVRPADTEARPMIVQLSGAFTSYFDGKSVSDIDQGNNSLEQTAAESVAGDQHTEEAVSESSASAVSRAPVPSAKRGSDALGRIIVIGDSDIFSDSYVAQFPSNLELGLNLADSLTLDDTLIAIRSKGSTDRPLKIVSDGTRSVIKFFGMLGVPVFVVLFGMFRNYLRRRDRKTFEI